MTSFTCAKMGNYELQNDVNVFDSAFRWEWEKEINFHLTIER